MNNSALIYCCRMDNCCGDKDRAIELARKLSQMMHVSVIVDEGAAIGAEWPTSVNLVRLMRLDKDGPESESRRRSITVRRDRILAEFERLKPRVVIIDNFPFAEIGLHGEILPLVERARSGIFGESLVICTTDGILADDSAGSENRTDRSAGLLNRYFDMILVQSDPVFARIEEFFQPGDIVHTPTYHTGFVNSNIQAPFYGGPLRDTSVLVTAGDGRCAGRLFRESIEAHKITWPIHCRPMKIVTGPGLPDVDFTDLRIRALDVDGVTIVRTVPDLRAEIGRVGCLIAHCSYQMALDIVATGTPSLLVPCTDARYRQQVIRAQRLVYWGAGRLLMPHHLNSASLANEFSHLLRFVPREIRFDMDGADKSWGLIAQAMHRHDYPAESPWASPQGGPTQH